ncbi:MAG: cytochrome C biogenesis protein CcdA [Phototrophicales bacterium]|nr:MAG: cytochrome C biogenesis protein CcdA [Phototrophicales bacterium]
MEYDSVVVLVTAQSEEQARHIAHQLLKKKLIACANLVPVNSLFMWEGQLQDEQEVLMIIKTRSQVFKEKIIETIKELHSYEVPEIIAMPIVLGSADYLRWIADEVVE